MPTNNVVRYRGLALCCIPKAANTSIKWAVLEAQGIPLAARRHRHPALHRGRPNQTKGYYTAAFVRHPCARLYSAWADKIRMRALGSERLEADCPLDIRRMVAQHYAADYAMWIRANPPLEQSPIIVDNRR